MATYIYETIPADPGQEKRRFEIQQSMNDAPLTKDPETGLPVKRIISGGYGYVGSSKDSGSSAPTSQGGGCGHGACGCGHGH